MHVKATIDSFFLLWSAASFQSHALSVEVQKDRQLTWMEAQVKYIKLS